MPVLPKIVKPAFQIQEAADKKDITDACSTTDCCPLFTICPRCCPTQRPRYAPDNVIKSSGDIFIFLIEPHQSCSDEAILW